MNNIKIIQAKTKELLQKAYDLRFEVFVKEQNVPPEIECDEYDRIATHVVAIDEKSGECIACGRLLIKDGIAKIGRVAVKKSYRGKGYGKKLCIKLIDIARKSGINDIRLNSQLDVVEFYKKLGFEEYGDIFMEANIKHIAMKLPNSSQLN
jgi:predicted GNAT family N-acyltransferase